MYFLSDMRHENSMFSILGVLYFPLVSCPFMETANVYVSHFLCSIYIFSPSVAPYL